jgi:hypothetical protein
METMLQQEKVKENFISEKFKVKEVIKYQG